MCARAYQYQYQLLHKSLPRVAREFVQTPDSKSRWKTYQPRVVKFTDTHESGALHLDIVLTPVPIPVMSESVSGDAQFPEREPR